MRIRRCLTVMSETRLTGWKKKSMITRTGAAIGRLILHRQLPNQFARSQSPEAPSPAHVRGEGAADERAGDGGDAVDHADEARVELPCQPSADRLRRRTARFSIGAEVEMMMSVPM